MRQKKIEAKTYQLLSEVMESLARMAVQKRWMGESYENHCIFQKLAWKPPDGDSFISTESCLAESQERTW